MAFIMSSVEGRFDPKWILKDAIKNSSRTNAKVEGRFDPKWILKETS